ncbi:hypothetical protein Tcan_04079 [Toxocara canis]|uniref:Pepsin inhibitor-3-like repeated domain-containing protein n=1 Tax=Toxocara canis TaxID=6265 RepID=A0A0B2VBN0_TOXCA|nr:hypothetical protein Tcan_04079 [Toxocara canis]
MIDNVVVIGPNMAVTMRIFFFVCIILSVSCQDLQSNSNDIRTFSCEVSNDTITENGISRAMTHEEKQKLLLYEQQMDAYFSAANDLWYKLKVFVNKILFGLWPKLPQLPVLPEVPCFCPDICGDDLNKFATDDAKISSMKAPNE